MKNIMFDFTPGTPRPRCICLHYIGDNGPCPVHGDPHGEPEKEQETEEGNHEN